MESYLNQPIEEAWTEEDIRKEFDLYRDKKIVARRYRISVAEINQILKRKTEHEANGI
ncbi:MAG: hypothetical protein SOT84_12505 [Bariatricus sp.]|nr:hypothetical protein [Bariatricus sp.]